MEPQLFSQKKAKGLSLFQKKKDQQKIQLENLVILVAAQMI